MDLKALLGAVSAIAIFGGAALAQTTPSTGTTTTPPAADTSAQAPAAGTGTATTPSTGAPATDSTMTTQAPATGTGATATTETASDTAMSGEPVVATHLMGQDVQGTDGEDIGSISDLVIDTGTGMIQQVVIRSGGVLGVGGKQIAVEFSEIDLVPNEGVQANLTQEQLDGMAEFDDDTTVSLDAQAPMPATGAAPGTPGMTGTTPAPGAVAPAPGAAGTAPAPRQ
jgi:sporulation protein YlmC with PRC-barrel domain